MSWVERARGCLAGGVSSQFRAGEPVVFSHGRGSRIWDMAGNEYIDYTLSQGPVVHGHSHPEILRAVGDALERGQIWNGLHTQEIELAEAIVALVPCAERVRLGCTGSEAVQAALRVARAATGRSRVIKFEGHYHGWLDSVAASINPALEQAGSEQDPVPVAWTAGMAPGSLDPLVVLPWNDLAAVERVLGATNHDVAAVIMEPVMCNAGCIEPAAGYLEGVRELCTARGTALVFDEVITGFRLARGGAQEYFGVTPDLAVFGKAIASGFPVSALVGSTRFMDVLCDGRTIHAGTLNAHVGGVAAALASLRLFGEAAVGLYERMHSLGQRLQRGLIAAAREFGLPLVAAGPGSVFHAGFVRSGLDVAVPVKNYRDVVRVFDTARYAEFVAQMARNGVRLIGRGIWYVSTAHTEQDIEQTLERARESLRSMRPHAT